MQVEVDADVHVAHGAVHAAQVCNAVAYAPAGHAATQAPLRDRTVPDGQAVHAVPLVQAAQPVAQARHTCALSANVAVGHWATQAPEGLKPLSRARPPAQDVQLSAEPPVHVAHVPAHARHAGPRAVVASP